MSFPWTCVWDEPAGRTSVTCSPDGYARLAAVHRRPPDRIVLFGKPPFPPYGPGVYREALAPPADAAAFDALVRACKQLDELDCCDGYSFPDADWPKLWSALNAAHAALALAAR